MLDIISLIGMSVFEWGFSNNCFFFFFFFLNNLKALLIDIWAWIQENLQNERSPSEDSDMYPHPYILINTKMINSKKEKKMKNEFRVDNRKDRLTCALFL